MNEELKPCSICGKPAVQMWDPEENIIKCSSDGVCHNALYGMYYNEWQSRPIEDALHWRIAILEREIRKATSLIQDLIDVIQPATLSGKIVSTSVVRILGAVDEWLDKIP